MGNVKNTHIKSTTTDNRLVTEAKSDDRQNVCRESNYVFNYNFKKSLENSIELVNYG